MRSTAITIMTGALVLALSGAASAQENQLARVSELLNEGIEQLGEKQYDEAVDSFAEMLELVDGLPLPEERKNELRALGHYNTACALSLKGTLEAANEHFARSVKLGFEDLEHIKQDSDLDNIRDTDRFKEVVKGIRKRQLADRRRQQARTSERTDEMTEAFLEKLSDGEALYAFDFDVTTLDGEQLSLADLRGKVVLVDVWGTWCGPCRRAVPHLVELYKEHKSDGLVILGLNRERVSEDKAPEVIQAFRKDNGIEYPCALLPDEVKAQIPGFRGYPTMVLIDREGRVRLSEAGYRPKAVLEAAIAKLLAEGAPEPTEEGGKKKGVLF